MRLTRAGVLEVLSSDYIRTARAKGLRPRTVLFKHALRNAIIPVVSLAAVQFGFMLGGSIVIETIFADQRRWATSPGSRSNARTCPPCRRSCWCCR